ncbi:MAG TPA: HAMP domain-containing sensor histidine kinase [Kofleriaceae bacterium]|nr:HAMP domain-containing sensor histidine kinase [Kofleriaceae bacterium]
MRRLTWTYLLIPAVLVAAVGLAAVSYIYSQKLSSRERLVIMDTMRELAEEKIVGIQTELIEADMAVFDSVDGQNLQKLQQHLAKERPAIESVVVLDENLAIVPGGFLTSRTDPDDIDRFRKLFESRIAARLDLENTALGERNHLHTKVGGRPYLFSYTRRRLGGKTYFVVIEASLAYIVGTVFPQFFDVGSPRIYQVVDAGGNIIYGYPFRGVQASDIVELGFPDTLSQWRLRVAQRESPSRAARGKRQIFDLVLIGLALSVIIAGLGILLVGIRRERRVSRLKSDFISNVSHELKTPLSLISMFGEMLAMRRVTSEGQATEYAEIIHRESMRLSRLIDNVLDFAKIERGVDAYEMAPGDLADVAARALELSRHRLERADLEAVTDFDGDLPAVDIDANAMLLATLNLLDNAIKYAAGSGRIEVSVKRARGGVELAVADSGPGIAADDQQSIFERFFRARDVRLKPIRGSGIGLAIVKHVAVAHGGDIHVDSEPGRGATFRLWIPAT